MEAVERRMEALTSKIAQLDAQLADPRLFTRDAANAVTLGKSRAETADALAAAEGEWMQAAEAYETAVSDAA